MRPTEAGSLIGALDGRAQSGGAPPLPHVRPYPGQAPAAVGQRPQRPGPDRQRGGAVRARYFDASGPMELLKAVA